MKTLITFICMIFFSLSANAQIGDFLNKMKTDIEKSMQGDAPQQGNQSGAAGTTSAQQPTGEIPKKQSSSIDLAGEMDKEKKQSMQKVANTASRYDKAIIYLCKYRDVVLKNNFDLYIAIESPCMSTRNPVSGACVFRWRQPLSKSVYPDSDDWIVAPHLPMGKTRPDITKVDLSEGKYTWEESGVHDPDTYQLDTRKNVLFHKRVIGSDNKTSQHSCSKIK